MTSRFFFVLFFGSDGGGGGVVVVVVWRHPEALLFSVCACSQTQRSLSFCFWIYNGIGKMQSNLSPFLSNSYSSRNALDDEYSLSLFPENKRLCFLGGGVGDDDDSEESVFLFVVFGRFFFDTHIRCGRRRRPTDMMSSS
jgi:hypothetical protein